MKRIASSAAIAIVLMVVFLPANSHALLGGPRIPAPEISATEWLNSKPLTLKELRGKVVIVDFWEYTCINCVRSFPYLKRWNAEYGPLGLVIIAVHTPEFEFGKNPAVVADAAGRFGLTMPIAVDSDLKTWDAFHNGGWPAEYIIDRNGRIADTHLGEGNFWMVEEDIQTLLKEANPKLDFSTAKYQIVEDEPEFGGTCMRSTPETYLGAVQAQLASNDGGLRKEVAFNYEPPREIPLDTFALRGGWKAMPEYLQTASPLASDPASLSLHYKAKSVYIVAGAQDGHPQRLYVTQDGKPLAAKSRGRDIKIEGDGRTYVELSQKRMYYVAKNPQFGEHTMTVTPSSSDIALYTFTFGNNCEPQFAHK